MPNILTCWFHRSRKALSSSTCNRIVDQEKTMKATIVSDHVSDCDTLISSSSSMSDLLAWETTYSRVIRLHDSLRWQNANYHQMQPHQRSTFELNEGFFWDFGTVRKLLDHLQPALASGMPPPPQLVLGRAYLTCKDAMVKIFADGDIGEDIKETVLISTASAVLSLGVVCLAFPEILPVLGFEERVVGKVVYPEMRGEREREMVGPTFAPHWLGMYPEIEIEYGKLWRYLRRLGVVVREEGEEVVPDMWKLGRQHGLMGIAGGVSLKDELEEKEAL